MFDLCRMARLLALRRSCALAYALMAFVVALGSPAALAFGSKAKAEGAVERTDRTFSRTKVRDAEGPSRAVACRGGPSAVVERLLRRLLAAWSPQGFGWDGSNGKSLSYVQTKT